MQMLNTGMAGTRNKQVLSPGEHGRQRLTCTILAKKGCYCTRVCWCNTLCRHTSHHIATRSPVSVLPCNGRFPTSTNLCSCLPQALPFLQLERGGVGTLVLDKLYTEPTCIVRLPNRHPPRSGGVLSNVMSSRVKKTTRFHRVRADARNLGTRRE